MTSMNIIRATILSGRGSDLIVLEIDAPLPIYPFKGNCKVKVDAAHGKAKEWLMENYPDVEVEEINLTSAY